MDNHGQSERWAALAVAVLVILTAWGNALAMLVFGALGLAGGLLLFRKSIARGGALAATVGFAVAIVIALVTLLR